MVPEALQSSRIEFAQKCRTAAPSAPTVNSLVSTAQADKAHDTEKAYLEKPAARLGTVCLRRDGTGPWRRSYRSCHWQQRLHWRPALLNPANDAKAMSDALRWLGFTVVELRDGNKAQMAAALIAVRDVLKGKQGVGMLYYAGHGLQVDEHNFMVPVDARTSKAGDEAAQAVDVSGVLDACRDNPFSRVTTGKGLAPPDAPSGTFFAYATAPGHVAEDGNVKSGNGLYTQYLLQELKSPNPALKACSSGYALRCARPRAAARYRASPPAWRTTSSSTMEKSTAFPSPPRSNCRRSSARRSRIRTESRAAGRQMIFTRSCKSIQTAPLPRPPTPTYLAPSGLLQVGASWKVSFQMTWLRPNMPSLPPSTSYSRITAREKVTVPAGTFDAFRVEVNQLYPPRRPDPAQSVHILGIARHSVTRQESMPARGLRATHHQHRRTAALHARIMSSSLPSGADTQSDLEPEVEDQSTGGSESRMYRGQDPARV